MKKFLVMSCIILLFYSIYFDLKVGTLPTAANTNEAKVVNTVPEGETTTFKKIKVQTGETVLTVLERIYNGNLPVSIETAVADFEKLNPGTSAHSVQAEKTYRFPLYD